ncbi:MAG: NAD(P)-binding domain-containing protein [Pirellulales bacterium]
MTAHRDAQLPYCVIGAGPSGLAALKNLQERGIASIGFEREDDVGGNWYYGRPCSSVCQSTHLISSKRMTEFLDHPMPRDYPPYPSHAQALDYLRSYAVRFRLYDRLRFRTTVTHIEPTPDGLWRVATEGGAAPQLFRGVVIANGHHWDPVWPELPGEFRGERRHAREYKTPEILRGKRVLVIGAGNSGCDIAVEAALNADAAFLSLRRGYHFLPKFLLGTPIDSGGEWLRRRGCPLWLIRLWTRLLVRVALGRPDRYGLPKPDHGLFQTHPIVNSQLLYQVGHGRIQVRSGVESCQGDRVRFTDGREERIDLIICATGYRVSLPFLPPSVVESVHDIPQLYLHAFHPRLDNLFVAGMIQPNSGLWPLSDYQTRVMAAFIAAQERDPATADWFRQVKAQPNPDLACGLHFDSSPRHRIEVEYYSYRERLKRLLARFERNLPPEPIPLSETAPCFLPAQA